MKIKKIIFTALVCGILVAFSGCSDEKEKPFESESQLDTTSATVTSVVTVTDDKGEKVTDDKGNDVTSVVTVVSKNDEAENTTTTISYVTSLSETIVTSNVTVTDNEGATVTDNKGDTVTSVVTSVSKVIITIPVTTTAAKTTTTARKTTTTKSTPATTTTVATTASSVNSTATTSTAASTTTTTTTTSQKTTEAILRFADIDYPTAEECFGTVSIPKVNFQMDLYMGDTNKILRKGIGMYYGSYLPGYEGKTIMCGHNSVGYLNDWVNYAKENDVIGEQILINTTYGDYVYEIYETAILSSSQTQYFTTTYNTSTLILYSCMETDYTDQRIYFVAKKISGPTLVQ